MNRRTTLKLVTTLSAVTILLGAALAAGPVAAARGGAHGSGQTTTASIRLNETDPHLGDSVTFTASGGKNINVTCYQGGLGNVVFAVEQPVGTSFLLGGTSSQWLSLGGSATCVAWLYNRNITDSPAQTSFYAGGAR